MAVSVLTLAVAAVTLLLPLDRSLRADAQRSLAETASAARPTFEALPRRDLHLHALGLRRAVRDLRRRAAADVVVIDRRGRVLAGTDLDEGTRFTGVAAALRSRTRVSDPMAGNAVMSAIRFRADGRRFGLVLRRPLRSVTAAVDVVRRALILAALLGLAVAVLAGTLLAGRLVRRLRGLRDAMAHVTDAEPGAAVPAVRATDEVGDLARSFTVMRGRLADQELARRAFVATASHELRTPLASLQLILDDVDEELRRDGAADLDDALGQLARARAQTERLVELATELLDLSRIDAHAPQRRELVELGELARAVAAEFPGTQLQPAPPQGCWTLADPGGVARIVRILADNAHRHGGGDAPVRIAVGRENGHVGLAVEDRGPGVPAAERELIFERFCRGAAAAATPGSGLGLAIGRELARGMGGDLRLVPSAAGARFVLELPAAEP